ncbi:MAG: hypothetical protein KME04_02240 [Pleurocapsa minor GSE-CHR-MK-17-07R]|jgi:spore germination protein YaaH|nr:hypothetical protein [Pleurocapsa minor GSE-CHR-MK 17-07R]
MKLTGLYRAVFVGLIALSSGVVVAQETPSGWCTSVWYPSSTEPDGLDSIRAHVDAIDIVHPFWYSPLPDGGLQRHDGAEDPDILALLREANILVIPSIFASVPTMLASDEAMMTHIEVITSLVELMDYDGIDIDYEGFPASNRDAFSLFIERLADALHANGRLITIALHAKTDDQGTWEGPRGQDWSRILPVVDIANLMTYDYTSRNQPPGPIAPSQWMADVVGYASQFTSLDKIRLGMPFYGYSWMRGSPPATTISYRSVMRWVDSFNLDTSNRHQQSHELLIELRVTGLPRQNIVLNDAASVADKLETVMSAYAGLGGVAIWGIGGEDPSTWDILSRYHTGMCALRDR